MEPQQANPVQEHDNSPNLLAQNSDGGCLNLNDCCPMYDTDTPQEEREKIRCNYHPFEWFISRSKTLWSQLTLQEISGSTGDLGTLIPLVVALARERSIYLTPALFFAGLSNVITGYMWDVPMPVQPMKSIAAVALADALSREQVMTAGLWMGILMVVLGLSQLIELVNIIIPSSVVSGLQVGVGLRLATKGIVTVAALPWADQADCIILAIVLAALCLYWLREAPKQEQLEEESPGGESSGGFWNRLWCCCCCGRGRSQFFPVGLFLLLVGIVFATVELATTNNADGEYDLPLTLFGAPVAVWALRDVTGNDFKVGLLEGAIPQLPLTTLNSVISVCCLAHSLYPEKRKPTSNRNDAVVSRRDVSISVGVMNLLLCPFGSMPNCHGAGGLAGQHRLGARHGASVVFLGTWKVLLAIFFGASVLTLFDAIPDAILGIMLSIAGQELATTGFILLVSESNKTNSMTQQDTPRSLPRPMSLRTNTVIAVITAMVIVALGKTHYGALSGWVAYMIYGNGTELFLLWIKGKWRTWKEKRRNEEEIPVGTQASSDGSTSLHSDFNQVDSP